MNSIQRKNTNTYIILKTTGLKGRRFMEGSALPDTALTPSYSSHLLTCLSIDKIVLIRWYDLKLACSGPLLLTAIALKRQPCIKKYIIIIIII